MTKPRNGSGSWQSRRPAERVRAEGGGYRYSSATEAQRPDAFLPDLAGSLGLGEVSGVGGVGEALVARANDGDLQPFETQMIYST